MYTEQLYGILKSSGAFDSLLVSFQRLSEIPWYFEGSSGILKNSVLFSSVLKGY